MIPSRLSGQAIRPAERARPQILVCRTIILLVLATLLASCGPAEKARDETKSERLRSPSGTSDRDTALHVEDAEPDRRVPLVAAQAPPTAPSVRLVASQEFDAHLEPGETHRFDLVAPDPDKTVSIEVEQQGVDVVLEVADAHQLVMIDTPTSRHGPEHFCWAVPDGAGIRLDIRAFAQPPGGRYRLRWAAAPPEAAAAACREADQHFQAAQNLLGGGEDDLKWAIKLYERASELWRQEPTRHRFQRALALRQTSHAQKLLGDLHAEQRLLRDALGVLDDLTVPQMRSVLWNRLGLSLLYSGQPETAAALFETALADARARRLPELAAPPLNNKALLADTLGRPHQAIELYKQSLEIWEEVGNRAQIALLSYNLGVSQTTVGRYRIARESLESALSTFRELGDLEFQAASSSAIARIEYFEGENRRAASRLIEALKLARAAGDPRRQAEALDHLGKIHRVLGNLDLALDAFRSALELVETIGHQRDLAHSATNLGQLLIDRGQAEEGLAALRRALPIFRRLGDRDALAHLHAYEAEGLRLLGRLTEARDAFSRAFNTTRSVRSSTRQQGFFERPFEVRQRHAERYVDLLIELARAGMDDQAVHRAFEVADLARAQSFHEMLLESEIDLFEDADPDLLARAKHIRQRLDAVPGTAHRPHSSEQEVDPAVTGRHIDQLLYELESVEAQIRRSSPRASELTYPDRIPIETIQELLEPGTLLISYALGEDRSFLFTVDRHSITVHDLPPRAYIEALATAAHRGFRQRKITVGRFQHQLDVQALARWILEPPADRIRLASRLIVIAEGALLYLPFAALPMPGTKALLNDHVEIVHLPLAAALPTLARRQAQRDRSLSKAVAIVADPVFDLADPRLGLQVHGGVAVGDAKLERLPASRREAEAIRAMVLGQPHLLALDFGANRELILSGKLQPFRYLHFATHALVDNQRPEMSRLIFSRVDESGKSREGSLYLHQIFTLDLPAELVVLSACQTALGENLQGEGIVGLTRGFFYAGASRLLVSLWNVNDDATADLMIEFYRGLLTDDLIPAAALRQAQLRIRNRYPERPPYAWAGFVLQGFP